MRKIGKELQLGIPRNIRKRELQNLIISGINSRSCNGVSPRKNCSPPQTALHQARPTLCSDSMRVDAQSGNLPENSRKRPLSHSSSENFGLTQEMRNPEIDGTQTQAKSRIVLNGSPVAWRRIPIGALGQNRRTRLILKISPLISPSPFQNFPIYPP